MKYRILDLHNDYWVRLIVVPFLGFCVPYFTELTPDGARESFIYNHPSIFTVFLVVIVFELNRYIVKNHKNIFIVNISLIYKVLLKFAFQLFFTFCLLFLFLSIWYFLFLDFKKHFDFLFNNIVFGLFVTLFFLMSYELSYFFYKWTEEQIKAKNLEIINSKAQINLLKNQLAPHFLFNSLSTLMSLVETNKDGALSFINSFSRMYRYILENSENISAPIDTELNFIKDYVAVYKANYGDCSIDLSIELPSKYYKYELPKLSLQMLVENALKHNLFSNKKPLVIEIGISSEKTYLYVKNNIQLKKSRNSTHLGLKNINDRYKKMGDFEIQIEKSDVFFSVQLPLIFPENL